MSNYLRFPSLLLWLTTLWVALWADLTLGNVVGGLLVALAVVAIARPTGVTGLERTTVRPFAALLYIGFFLSQLVKSNLVVAWEIVTPGLRINRAIIAVPLHTTSAGVITLVANSVTLTPGTVTVDIVETAPVDGDPALGNAVDGDTPAHTLFVHVLHFIDVESVRRDVLRLERLAIKAFGQRSELDLVDAELAQLARGSKGVSR